MPRTRKTKRATRDRSPVRGGEPFKVEFTLTRKPSNWAEIQARLSDIVRQPICSYCDTMLCVQSESTWLSMHKCTSWSCDRYACEKCSDVHFHSCVREGNGCHFCGCSSCHAAAGHAEDSSPTCTERRAALAKDAAVPSRPSK